MSSQAYQSRPLLPREALADDLSVAATARTYARAGWPVVLLTWAVWTTDLTGGRVLLCSCGQRAGDGPGFCRSVAKHPYAKVMTRGLADATTDAATLDALLHRFPRMNLGIRTGTRPAGAGVVVLDVDPRHGGTESLYDLERAERALPPTVEALTGGGGRHLYFTTTSRLPSSAGRLGSGLDVKGEAAYVVAPPSRHASGSRYYWEWSSHPAQVPPAPLPGWLERRLLAPRGGRSGDRPGTAWAVQLLRDGAPEGQRNDACFRLAGYLRRFGIPAAVITALLSGFAARCRPPLDEAEVQHVVRSVVQRYAPWSTIDVRDIARPEVES